MALKSTRFLFYCYACTVAFSLYHKIGGEVVVLPVILHLVMTLMVKVLNVHMATYARCKRGGGDTADCKEEANNGRYVCCYGLVMILQLRYINIAYWQTMSMSFQ